MNQLNTGLPVKLLLLFFTIGAEMDKAKFSMIADSLKQYRRADLKDFDKDMQAGQPAIDHLYVDPLPSNAVLSQVLRSTTTFLLGRKGTGKSTIFAKAQSYIRKEGKNLSIYIDVKSLYDLLNTFDCPVRKIEGISEDVLRVHLLRKSFLSSVLSEMVKEIEKSSQELSFADKVKGRRKQLQNIAAKIRELESDVKNGKLSVSELPILQCISSKKAEKKSSKNRIGLDTQIGASLSASGKIDSYSKASSFDEEISDDESYQQYSDAVLRSFPYSEILQGLKQYLDSARLNKLIIFFDDFSEIDYMDQRLFVDVVLAPMNNSSEDRIKIKVAGYPGRVYYGKIDPGKIDTFNLDFSSLYKDKDIQTSESRAIDYTQRLIDNRFDAFCVCFEDFFDMKVPKEEYIRLLFECTFNVPRIMGFILNYCYIDRISHDQLITLQVIRMAASKYYDNILNKYFEQEIRYVVEPFDRKIDRCIQKDLLNKIVEEAKVVRKKIVAGEIGGNYFGSMNNPPVSHFYIGRDMESILDSLEFNFLVNKYHEMRDKDGRDITVYALSYGLCEYENIPWGYPRGKRDDRSYFVQRCFSYNRVLHEFLAQRQTIRCQNCGASFPMDKSQSFALYKWACPECHEGLCMIINLADDYRAEIESLNVDLMLEEVELEILQVLNHEDKPMRANQISILIDRSYQLVGRRTSKLRDMGYVEKTQEANARYNSITELAKEIYFS